VHEYSPFWAGNFIICFVKKTTIFTVLYRHAHSDWLGTDSCVYVIGYINIMLTWKYIIVLAI